MKTFARRLSTSAPYRASASARTRPSSLCPACGSVMRPIRERAAYERIYSQTRRPFSSGMKHRAPSTATTSAKESLVPTNHYEYFPQTLGSDSIPPKGPFDVDLKALRKEFLQLQAKAHPDMAPAEKKRQAEGLSARINEAYKTLQDPLRRAQYLLGLRGIDVAEDETAKVEDPELLMEVLETRETIEEAQDESDLASLKDLNDGRIAQSVVTLAQAFQNDDTEAAKAESIRLRYWTNIKDSIDGWEKGKPVVLVH